MAKSRAELASLARSHTASALKTLAHVMNEPTAPQSARIAAANSLLDRGWGKAVQILAGDEDAPLTIRRIEVVVIGSSSEAGCSAGLLTPPDAE